MMAVQGLKKGETKESRLNPASRVSAGLPQSRNGAIMPPN